MSVRESLVARPDTLRPDTSVYALASLYFLSEISLVQRETEREKERESRVEIQSSARFIIDERRGCRA